MRTRLAWQAVALAGVTILAAFAAFIALGATVHALQGTTAEARAHERTGIRAQRSGALVVDAETAVRGYVLTREEQYLAPLRRAQNELPALTSRLSAGARGEAERELAQRVAAEANAYIAEYALPTIDRARREPAIAGSLATSQAGKRRVDAFRADVRALVDEAERESGVLQARASDRASQALLLTVIAAIVLIGLLALLIIELRRRVLRPIAAATEAAHRIGSGDLTVRLPVDRDDELARLAAALNQMSTQLRETGDELEAQHTELESQNAELESQSVELEAQTAELERRGEELSEANAELAAQRDELRRASEELERNGQRMRRYAEVADALAQVPDVRGRAARLMTELAETVGCELAAVYVRADDESGLTLADHRGLPGAPHHIDAAGALVGRAVRERRPVTAEHPGTSLELETLGMRASVRHEVHLPLLIGRDREDVLGVVSLARTADRPFSGEELETLGHLADTSAVAVYNAYVSTQRERAAGMLRSILDSVNEAILVVTADRQVRVANPPMLALARRLTGAAGDAPLDLAELGAAFRREVRDPAALDEQAAMLANDPLAVDRAILELPASGTWLERYAAPVLESDGEHVAGRIIVIRDITEERRAEQAKDDLMSTVSHELRTPLAAILGFTELLATRDFEAEERREYLTTVHDQATRLSSLVDDFLDLQRIERRGIEEAEPVDLRAVIDEQVRLYAAQSSAHALSAEVEGEVVVQGDPRQLGRVLGNLISNAIKYSPVGGPVRIEARRQNGRVITAVVDQGLGIADADRERIFDRFYRADAAAGIGGTGLGLALVRDIVQAHGGEVGVESVVGEGSRFWCAFPATTPGRA